MSKRPNSIFAPLSEHPFALDAPLHSPPFERGFWQYTRYPVFSAKWLWHRFKVMGSLCLAIALVIGMIVFWADRSVAYWHMVSMNVFLSFLAFMFTGPLLATGIRNRAKPFKREALLIIVALFIGGVGSIFLNKAFNRYLKEHREDSTKITSTAVITVGSDGTVIQKTPITLEKQEQIIVQPSHASAVRAEHDRVIALIKEGKAPAVIATTIRSTYSKATGQTTIRTVTTTSRTPADSAEREQNAKETELKVDSDLLFQLIANAILILCFNAPSFFRYFFERRRWSEYQQEQALLQARQEKQEANQRLAILRAQVEPHFLFNTLGSVRALVPTDPSRAVDTIDALVDYLRASIPKLRAGVESDLTTVGQELDLSTAYLKLMQVRMGSRLQFEVICPIKLREQAMPPLMLITLVENSIKHGLEPKVGPGTVTITVSEHAGSLRVQVQDDGVGLKSNLSSGIGLANLQSQLSTMFGTQGSLELQAPEEGGYIATMVMPMHMGKDDTQRATPNPLTTAAAAA